MTAPMLRLLADDLTGALDTAAEMAELCGPIPVHWHTAPQQGSAAFSSGSREATRDEAIKAVRAFTPLLAGADIAYRKLDSLLRGNVAAELAACWATGFWRHCVLAPAFPAQGRITRDGGVFARREDGGYAPIAMPDWSAENLVIHHGHPAQSLRYGITWFDADSDEDLAQIAALAKTARGPVLWAGSGGLARALAAQARIGFDTKLQAPVLGLFGSDQIATARQLAACSSAWLRISDASEAPRVVKQLATCAALVSINLPDGTSRAIAAQRIADIFTGLLGSLACPGTLIVAGGETLRAICDALGADGLVATGLVTPGVPRSILQGGAWNG
ncbi:MAG: four-carbon acid sugar kinase family protein, partial [Alphaproteobacteria bacterium]